MNLDIDVQAFRKISYGVYIVTAGQAGKYNGQLLNVAMQVTANPIQVAVCVNKGNLTYEYIKEFKTFGLSILEQDTPLKFMGTWGFKSGRDIDKFQGVNFKAGKTGAPLVLDHSLAVMESKVVGEMDTGSHVLFIGEVIFSEDLKAGSVLTYEYYQQVKKGQVSRNAPTYSEKLPHKKNDQEDKMKKYICDVCGYVYDPAEGDPGQNISPDTPFENLPEAWVCPECGAGKDQFSPES